MHQSAGNHRSPAENVWMDEWTKQWMKWNAVWNQLQPLSKYGHVYKRNLRPYREQQKIEWEQEIVYCQRLQSLRLKSMERECIVHSFKQLKDIKVFVQLLENGDTGQEVDWFDFKHFLWHMRILFQYFIKVDHNLSEDVHLIEQLLTHLQPEQQSLHLEELSVKLHHLTTKKREYERELHHFLKQKREIIEKKLNVTVQARNEIYLSKKHRDRVELCLQQPFLQVKKETPFDIVFEISPPSEEKSLLQNIDLVEEQILEEERNVLQSLANQIRPYVLQLKRWTEQVGLWDWRWTKCQWANHETFTWPNYNKQTLMIQKGLYLPLQLELERQGKKYSPLSIKINDGLTTIVGSNMGGKSIAMKTIAFLSALAHYALPVPAAHFSTPLFEEMVAISGDLENVEDGVSTFGAEMKRLVSCLPKKRRLLLLDELARGTNPQEGEALAVSFADYFHQQVDQMTVMVTHFPKVTKLHHARHLRVKGLQADGHIDYTIEHNDNRQIPQHAIQLAYQIGVPKHIVNSAKQWLREGETDGNN